MPLAIWLVLGTSLRVFEIFSAAFILFAAWEWTILSGIKNFYQKLCYLIAILAALSIAQFFSFYVLIIGILWWLYALLQLINYQRNPSKTIISRNNLLAGLFAIIPCWIGLNSLRATVGGAELLLFFLFMLWASDTGAYLVGSKIGRRKLAPAISPGKSIEGYFGGIMLMLIVIIFGIWILKIPSGKWLGLVILAIVMNFFSVIGDLYESMLKRKFGVKDSGNLIPGHGGVLDRIDSWLAASPIFALGMHFLGYI
jgi:phosphatidate cytidylyltransferase